MATTKTAAPSAKKAAKKPAKKAATAKKTTNSAKVSKEKTTEKITMKTPEFDIKKVEEFWANGAEKAQEQFAKAQASVEELTAVQKESVEVLMEAAGIAQKGFEAIAAEQATYTQAAYEDGVAAAKEAFAATNVQDAIELQTKFAKTAFEGYFGHMKKVGEMFQSSANDVVAPLNAQATKVWEGVYKAS